MFNEDIGLVKSIAREIAKEEIAKAIKELTPKPVDINEIVEKVVSIVLDKIKIAPAETPSKKVK